MLLRRCAWCKKLLGVMMCKKWGVTHGICDACSDAMLDEEKE